MAGLEQQVEVLVRMLGIRSPDLKAQARKLLLNSLSENDSSPITDGSFLGRIKKLLFKPPPKKQKQQLQIPTLQRALVNAPQHFEGGEPHTRSDDSVTPKARELSPYRKRMLALMTIGYSEEDPDYDEEQDPSIACQTYTEDTIEHLSHGEYNSRGQRLDEDGDIVRDERVYICEDAIYNFAGGTPHITDTYDLYALVRAIPIENCRTAADEILLHGVFQPIHHITDLHSGELQLVQPHCVEEMAVSGPSATKDVVLDYPSVHTATAPTSEDFPSLSPARAKQLQKRNLIAHFVRTIGIQQDEGLTCLTKRQRKKLIHQRRCAEKARIRQLKIFLKAIET